MIVARTIAELHAARRAMTGHPDGGNVAFVPTMGALHAGHRSLVEFAATGDLRAQAASASVADALTQVGQVGQAGQAGQAKSVSPSMPHATTGLQASTVRSAAPVSGDVRTQAGSPSSSLRLGTVSTGHATSGPSLSAGVPLPRSVIVSIFVNPTQFTPSEDFARYPRPLEDDLTICEAAGADVVFVPSVDTIYPPGLPAIRIELPGLTDVLEGAIRREHFSGVCQIVAKLFNLVQPTHAIFGRKDFQQLRVIESLVAALDWPIAVIGCPTIRDADGLAMSSRNRYLLPQDRARAGVISRALRDAEVVLRGSERSAAVVARRIDGVLRSAAVEIDYVAIVNPVTLAPVDDVSNGALIAIAARVGKTRLIDNIEIAPAALI